MVLDPVTFGESCTTEVLPVLLPVDCQHLALTLVSHHLALHLKHFLLDRHCLVCRSMDDLGLVLNNKPSLNSVRALVGCCAGVVALI